MQVAREVQLYRLPIVKEVVGANLNEWAHNNITSTRAKSIENKEQEILHVILEQPTEVIRINRIGLEK